MGLRSRSNAASARGTSSPASPNARSRAIASSNARRVPEQLDLRLERRLQRRTHERIRSVGADHDVRGGELAERGHGAAILDLHAGTTAQVSQDLLERKAPDRGKAVTVDVHALVAVHDALNRPAFHRRLQDVRELRLIAL